MGFFWGLESNEGWVWFDGDFPIEGVVNPTDLSVKLSVPLARLANDFSHFSANINNTQKPM